MRPASALSELDCYPSSSSVVLVLVSSSCISFSLAPAHVGENQSRSLESVSGVGYRERAVSVWLRGSRWVVVVKERAEDEDEDEDASDGT